MSDETAMGTGTQADAKTGGRQEQRLLLNSQYIKDLSFENPNAPLIYADVGSDSGIDVSIDVDFSHLQDRLYEVVLSLHIKATAKEKTAFLIELAFAGLATASPSVADEEIESLLLTEVPRFLFPFARAIVGEVTRDGGFPPLLINPIDFDELYSHRRRTDQSLAAGA